MTQIRFVLFSLALAVPACFIDRNGQNVGDGGSSVEDGGADSGPAVTPDNDGDGFLGDPDHPDCRGSLVQQCDCNDTAGDAGFNTHPGADPETACAFVPDGADVNCDGEPDCEVVPPVCDCDDADPCTTDICDADRACQHIVPADAPPACLAPPCSRDFDCDDGIACTADICRADGCDHANDDRFCGRSSMCDPDHRRADRRTGCVDEELPPDCVLDRDCSDGLFCNGVERCVADACVAGILPCPEDGIACTVDSCMEATRSCEHVPDASRCDADETCDQIARGCVARRLAECRLNSDCSDDDGFFCRVPVCRDGACVDVPRTCDDANALTADSCSEAADTCVFTPLCDPARDCDDSLFCNGIERCAADGSCEPGTPRSCDDADASTTDSCDEAGDSCVHTPRAAEVCDGADNDGDGAVDELFTCRRGATQSCDFTRDGRVFAPSTQVCNASCEWDPCRTPDEVCNDRDDDLDGLVDESFECRSGQTRLCTFFVGGRATNGTQSCSASCTWNACQAPPEICNGVDDNLNGSIDEGFDCSPGQTGSCMFTNGGCSVASTRTCSASCAWNACVQPAEVCANGRDDNCNGSVDEGCGGGGGMCVLANTVRVTVDSGLSGVHEIWTDMEGADRVCSRGWNPVSCTGSPASPCSWTFSSGSGLRTFNIRMPDGGWCIYTPVGGAGSSVRNRCTITVVANGASTTLNPGNTFDPGSPSYSSINVNSANFGLEESGWGATLVCVDGATRCETNCGNSSDDDGDGVTDCSDRADCSEVWRPAGRCL